MAKKEDDELDESLLRKTDKAREEDGAEKMIKVHAEAPYIPFRKRLLNTNAEEEEQVPLWLVTFGDCIALMLTFFVLLYAMSTPSQEEWERMTASMTQEFGEYFTKKWNAGFQDTINIDVIDNAQALNLNYVRALIAELMKRDERLSDLYITQQKERLIVSLPSDLLFDTGDAEIQRAGKRAVFVLGDVLSRMKNKIEVVGHADPRAVSGQYQSNWHLSLARAASVAAVLQDVGYRRDIKIRGLSDALYAELPEDLEAEKRLQLSRRVDIVIMRGDGRLRQRLMLDE